MLPFVRRRLATLLVLCLSTTAFAQTTAQGWRWLQPRPTAGDLRDVAFADTTTGVAVGARGLLLRSTDGGGTWTDLSGSQSADLKAVSLSGRTGVAGGAGGTLLRSENTGSTWVAVPVAGLASEVVDAHLVDASRGFAVASDGTVVGSTDGFRTAQVRGRVTFGPASAIWMASETRGWLVGGNAAGTEGWIAATADGGRTWTQDFTVRGGALLSVTGVGFQGRAVVLAAGAGLPRAVVLDEFQGRGWEQVELPGGPITGLSLKAVQPEGAEIWFAGEDGLWGIRDGDQAIQRPVTQTRPRIWSVVSPSVGTAFGVGEGGTIVRATYGQPAAVVASGNRRERFTAGSFPMDDGRFGVLADNQPGAPRLWITRDGGASLTGAQVAPSPIADITFVNERRGFGALENGDIYTTGDGAGTFQRVTTTTFRPRALAFMDERNGYAAGDGLFRTTNGGVDWRSAFNAPNAGRVTDVAVRGPHAVAVTESGAIWQRMGSGVDSAWTLLQANVADSLVSVSVAGDGRFIAGGSRAARGVAILGGVEGGTAITPFAYDRPVTSVAAVGTRFFALLDDGRITEVSLSGTAPVYFSSRARLTGLVPRTTLSSNGTTTVAPFAVGDFGALLVHDGPTITPPPNRPPVVRVDPPVLELALGQVDKVMAIASDPEGEPVTYRWEVREPGLKIGDSASPQVEVTWEVPPVPGMRAQLVVTVCDQRGACTTATVDVLASTTTEPNRPPVASAVGATAVPGDIVILDGFASSDPDGDPLTYEWTQLTGTTAEMLGPNDQEAIAIVAPEQPGTLVFALEVCDPAGLCARTEVTVVVTQPNGNSPPVASAGADLTVDPGQSFVLDASGSFDADNEPLQFGWRQVSGPTRPLRDPRQTAIRLVAGAAGEQYRFVVRVCDPANACTEAGVNVTVRGGATNRPPVVVVPPPVVARVGERTLVSVGVSDPENDPVTVHWRQIRAEGVPDVPFEVAGPSSIAVTFGPEFAGLVVRYELVACDTRGGCADPVVVEVRVTADQPGELVANAGPDQRVRSGDTVVLDGSRSIGAEQFRWRQSEGPSALLTDGTVRVAFTAPTGPARLVFVLAVADASGREARDEVVVEVEAPSALVADAGTDFAVGWLARVQLDGRASTGPAPLTFSWKGPADVQLAGSESATPVFHAPSRDVALTFVLSVCAADGACAEDEVVVTVTQGANLPPLVDAGPDRVGESTRSVALDGTGTRDPEGAPLRVKWTQQSGTPATLDAAEALWTRLALPAVAAEEELVFVLEACDARDACATDTVTVRVLPRLEGTPAVTLSIAGRPEATVDESSEFTLVVDATCPAAACREPELVLESGPPIERVGRTLVHRAPAVAKALRFTYRATVCDAGGRCGVATLDGLVLDTVNEAPVPVVRGPESTVPRARVVLDASSSYDPNGESLSFRWSWTSGPVELALLGAETDRTRFDVPADGATGAHVFSLEVCDARGACATVDRPLEVVDGVPANRPPVAEFGDDRAYVLGTLPVLDASASFDPDGDELTYEWGPAGQFERQEGATVVWTAPPTDSAAVVTLRVCDTSGACDEDTVTFRPVSIPPERGESSATFGATQTACGCGGAGASMLLLAGLVPLLRRRRSLR